MICKLQMLSSKFRTWHKRTYRPTADIRVVEAIVGQENQGRYY